MDNGNNQTDIVSISAIAGEGRVRRWETATHYYQVTVAIDLFGDVTLLRSWGRLGEPQGQVRLDVLPSLLDAEQRLARIAKRRQRGGYQTIGENGDE